MEVDYSKEASDKDKQYVEMYLNGSEAQRQRAANHFYNRYNKLFLKTATGKFGLSKDDAEDLVSEIWIHIFKKMKLFKGKSKFSTWIYRLYTNKFIDLKRAGKFRTINEDMYHRLNRESARDTESHKYTAYQTGSSKYQDDPLLYELKVHEGEDSDCCPLLLNRNQVEAMNQTPFNSMSEEDVTTAADIYKRVADRISKTDRKIMVQIMQGNSVSTTASELGLSTHWVAKQSSLINRYLREEIENANLDD